MQTCHSQASTKKQKSARRSSACEIVITQSFKPSTNAEEMSIRIATDILSEADLLIGDKVDVLRDDKNDLWMIRKTKKRDLPYLESLAAQQD